MALWNLTQLANALFGLIEETEPLQKILDQFADSYLKEYQVMMLGKLGLFSQEGVAEDFIAQLQDNMSRSEIDMTLFFRSLSDISGQDREEFWGVVQSSSYRSETELKAHKDEWFKWHSLYSEYLKNSDSSQEERLSLIHI